jgi:serine/threonine protein kinase
LDLSYLTKDQLKCYANQLLNGLFFFGNKSYVCEKISIDTILINASNYLVIGCLPLINTENCILSEDNLLQAISPNLIYYPPEILFGISKFFSKSLVWIFGTILFFLATKHQLFNPQVYCPWGILVSIFGKISFPSIETLPYQISPEILKSMKNFTNKEIDTADFFHAAGLEHYDHLFDLMLKIFQMNPVDRIDFPEIFEHPFFMNTKDFSELPHINLPEFPSIECWLKDKNREPETVTELPRRRPEMYRYRINGMINND